MTTLCFPFMLKTVLHTHLLINCSIFIAFLYLKFWKKYKTNKMSIPYNCSGRYASGFVRIPKAFRNKKYQIMLMCRPFHYRFRCDCAVTGNFVLDFIGKLYIPCLYLSAYVPIHYVFMSPSTKACSANETLWMSDMNLPVYIFGWSWARVTNILVIPRANTVIYIYRRKCSCRGCKNSGTFSSL